MYSSPIRTSTRFKLIPDSWGGGGEGRSRLSAHGAQESVIYPFAGDNNGEEGHHCMSDWLTCLSLGPFPAGIVHLVDEAKPSQAKGDQQKAKRWEKMHVTKWKIPHVCLAGSVISGNHPRGTIPSTKEEKTDRSAKNRNEEKGPKDECGITHLDRKGQSHAPSLGLQWTTVTVLLIKFLGTNCISSEGPSRDDF